MALFVGAVASWFVNINRFSLHALYRNRLIRAFLGASHTEQRKPNPFTDFDEVDNLRVWQLWPPKDGGNWPAVRGNDWQPYHVINMALNIVSTKRLAWQERKAEAFVVSPLYSGTACGKSPDANGVLQYQGAFRPSDEYGDSKGISLGTALAISGAAASPNMGYNSSPTLAFLLTLFNVRLGWWLGNPSEDNPNVYGAEGPRIAIAPLLNEMIGNTTDESKYVYLVRRRALRKSRTLRDGAPALPLHHRQRWRLRSRVHVRRSRQCRAQDFARPRGGHPLPRLEQSEDSRR